MVDIISGKSCVRSRIQVPKSPDPHRRQASTKIELGVHGKRWGPFGRGKGRAENLFPENLRVIGPLRVGVEDDVYSFDGWDVFEVLGSFGVYWSSFRLRKSVNQFQVSSAVCPFRRSLIFPNLMQGMEGGPWTSDKIDKLLDLIGCYFSYADIHQQENLQG